MEHLTRRKRLAYNNRLKPFTGDKLVFKTITPLSARLALLIAILLSSLPLAVFAQDPPDDLPQTYITHDGKFSFQYPSGWTIAPEELDGLLLLTNSDYEDSVFFDPESTDSVVVIIVTPDNFLEIFPDIDELPRTPRDLLEVLIVDTDDPNIFTDIQEGTLNGHRAVFANVDDGELSGQVFVLDLDDGDLVMALAASASGVYAQYQEQVLSIVASMTLHRYNQGDFRLVTSQAMNLSFEMPAEYFYNDMVGDGSLIFGTNEDVFNNGAPAEGEFMGLFATDLFIREGLDLDIEGFESPEHALAIFSDSVIANILNNVSFSDVEHVLIDESPLTDLVQFTFTSDTAEGVVIAFKLPDGRIMVGSFVVSNGELPDYEAIISQITTSINPFGTATPDNDLIIDYDPAPETVPESGD
jgi:hypothetical protein